MGASTIGAAVWVCAAAEACESMAGYEGHLWAVCEVDEGGSVGAEGGVEEP